MIKYILRALLSLLFFGSIFTSAIGDSQETLNPIGTWLVKDGTAHIRIVECDTKLWGIISWVDKPGRDENNPDASKRTRSVLGMPILLGMSASQENAWKGQIYNADNGKIYNSTISLQSAGVLHVEGCVWGGVFCGSEDWTRILKEDSHESNDKICTSVD